MNLCVTLDPGCNAAERKRRRKVQNRLNQRAHRKRIKKDTEAKTTNPPFAVCRWRLDEDENIPDASSNLPCHPYHQQEDSKWESDSSQKPRARCQAYEVAGRTIILNEDLLADNLLHLVHLNALRGLIRNKDVIASTATYFTLGDHPRQPLLPFVEDVYPEIAVLVPTTTTSPSVPAIPLVPTTMQSNIPHYVWINLFPFPRLRDNLITWEKHFDHAEFVGDMIGNLIDLSHFFRPQSDNHCWNTCNILCSEHDEDELTASRTGLILWGEAHLAENWEFTPGFLRKWGWAFQGCESLLETSNRWRLSRGANPMKIERG